MGVGLSMRVRFTVRAGFMGWGTCTKCRCQRFDRAISFSENLRLRQLEGTGPYRDDAWKYISTREPVASDKCTCRHQYHRHDGLYGAIASTLHEGAMSFVWSYCAPSRAQAEEVALASCRGEGSIIAWGFDTFLAVAASEDGAWWGSSPGPTRELAEREAVKNCRGRNIQVKLSFDTRQNNSEWMSSDFGIV
jgi:Domain of unknown function (DUF4189)